MIKSNQNNLESPLIIKCNNLDVSHNDMQYKYEEMPRIFYDRVRVKDPMTIYIVHEQNGYSSVYLGSNKIPNNVYMNNIITRVPIHLSFTDWLYKYIRHLIINYHDNTILASYKDTVKPEIICNILQASGKYIDSDIELFPYYIKGICEGNLELKEKLDYIQESYDRILDAFAYCNFFDMVNKIHTEKDADKYDIDKLISTIITVLS